MEHKLSLKNPKAIQCPQPLVPHNGKIDSTSGAFGQRKYAVGALLTFSCQSGFSLEGDLSKNE